MSALLAPPPPVRSSRRPVRWTVAQFHQMGELGYFAGRRASLIRGVIVEEGPMNPPHAIACMKSEDALRDAFGRGWFLWTQKPLVLGSDTDPQPDIAVLATRPTLSGGHPTTAELVIEVADSSFDDDTTTKAELYATAGIADYWVLDVDGRTLHVFRDPVPLPAGLGATAYRTHLTFTDTQSASPLAAPNAVVSVSDLLP